MVCYFIEFHSPTYLPIESLRNSSPNSSSHAGLLHPTPPLTPSPSNSSPANISPANPSPRTTPPNSSPSRPRIPEKGASSPAEGVSTEGFGQRRKERARDPDEGELGKKASYAIPAKESLGKSVFSDILNGKWRYSETPAKQLRYG
ncbi:proline-rich receptor-like protein kinase PERK2 [Zingiber officinale]|uniref:proline-rich receptor-like protein kinase PERK2 n=1 Tax=Zingiber officinale TaxID=94328 RepID=UPI001C4CF1C5|nr:proline-rich receptor-like protein kinase PERK2 [Zingiber officinale]